jgi:hypothetical protein
MYSVLVAIIALLVGYSVVNSEQGLLWIAFAAAVTGVPAVEKARSKVTPVP